MFNVGGGHEVSTSLHELTAMCRDLTGNVVPVAGDPDTSPVDVPLYLPNTTRVERTFGWKPERSVRGIVEDIASWIRGNEARLRPILE